MIEHQRAAREPHVAADPGDQIGHHQGVHAQLEEIPLRRHARGIVEPHRLGNLTLHEGRELPLPIRRGHGAQAVHPGGRRAGRTRGVASGCGTVERSQHGPRTPRLVDGPEHVPVDVGHHRRRRTRCDQAVENTEGGRGVEADVADAFELRQVFAGGHPAAAPGTPVDYRDGQAQPAAFVAEGVQEGVRGTVMRAPLRAQNRRDGREAEEEIQLETLRRLMQQPGTGSLGRKGVLQLRVGHRRDWQRGIDTSRVHDAAQRLPSRGEPRYEAFDRLRLRHVDRHHLDTGAACAQLFHGLGGAGRSGGAARQDEMTSPTGNQPLGRPQSKRAQSASDEIRAFVGESRHAGSWRLANQPGHEAAAPANCHLVVVGARQQLGREHAGHLGGRSGFEVDGGLPHIGGLERRGSPETPGRRLRDRDRVRVAWNGNGGARDHGERRPRSATARRRTQHLCQSAGPATQTPFQRLRA